MLPLKEYCFSLFSGEKWYKNILNILLILSKKPPEERWFLYSPGAKKILNQRSALILTYTVQKFRLMIQTLIGCKIV